MILSATNFSIYKRYQIIAIELSKMMKTIIRLNLEDRLSNFRRQIPANFIASVFLSDLIELSVIAIINKISIELQYKVSTNQNVATSLDIAINREITNLKSLTQSDIFDNSLIVISIDQRSI